MHTRLTQNYTPQFWSSRSSSSARESSNFHNSSRISFFQEISLSKSFLSETQREKSTMHVFNDEIILFDSPPFLAIIWIRHRRFVEIDWKPIGVGGEACRFRVPTIKILRGTATRSDQQKRRNRVAADRVTPPILPARFLGGGLDFVKKCRRLRHSIRKRSEKNTWPKEFFDPFLF